VNFLTETYNETYIQCYNLAKGGATIDNDVVRAGIPSLKDQVQKEFIPIYGDEASTVAPPWDGSNSLFAIFIGINDIHNSYTWQNQWALHNALIDSYKQQVDALYYYGARNFVLLNVPPINVSPDTASKGPEKQGLEKSALADFNYKVHGLISGMRSSHPDGVFFEFDTHYLYETVISTPKAYPQTQSLQNTTEYCGPYTGYALPLITYLVPSIN
jgi:phospholipase/lecithinase/hemolysin